jgi:hypothetical protein
MRSNSAVSRARASAARATDTTTDIAIDANGVNAYLAYGG